MPRTWLPIGLLACAPAPSAWVEAPPPPLPFNAIVSSSQGGGIGKTMAAGDLNGDGMADLAIGAPFAGPPADVHGRVDVAYGGPTGLSPWLHLQLANTFDNCSFGDSVSVPGDLDQDGFDDLLVAAAVPSTQNPLQHGVFLYRGSPLGVDSSSPARLDVTPLLQTRPDLVLTEDWHGTTVHGRSDINGDGVPDLSIGATSTRHNGRVRGAIFWWPGPISFPSPANGVMLVSPVEDTLMLSAASPGDLDGDGFGDLVVGLKNRPPDEPGSMLWVVPGGPAGPRTADSRLFDAPPGVHDYGIDVETIDDVDDDGHADLLIVSGFDHTRPNPSPPRTFIRYGSPELLDPTRQTVFAGDSGVPNLLLIPLGGSAGDINEDGYADVAMVGLDPAGVNDVHLLFGGSDGIDLARSHRFVLPQADAGVGSAFLGNFDHDMDGLRDLLVGDQTSNLAGAGLVWRLSLCDDGDGDGMCASFDCDDGDPGIGPEVEAYEDLDGDGWGGQIHVGCPGQDTTTWSGDCDDADAKVHPGGIDVVGDGIDRNCDDLYLCWVDEDGDGFTSGETVLSQKPDCAGEGETPSGEVDCRDTQPQIGGGDCSAYTTGSGDAADVPDDEATEATGCGGCRQGRGGAGWALAVLGVALRRRGARRAGSRRPSLVPPGFIR